MVLSAQAKEISAKIKDKAKKTVNYNPKTPVKTLATDTVYTKITKTIKNKFKKQLPPDTLNEEQKELYKKLVDFITTDFDPLDKSTQYIGISAPPGCVDGDTEFLSESGWKKISEYDGESVMQIDPDSHVGSFVKPIRYIKEECSTFYHFKTDRGIDQMLSSDHDIGYVTYDVDTIRKENVLDFLENPSENKRVLTSYKYEGRPLGLSELDIRIGVAIKADASLQTESTGHYRFNFKRTRKIERLEMLLNQLEWEYKKTYSNKTGYTSISFYAPHHTKSYKDWSFCSMEDAQIIFDEYRHWDGEYDPKGEKLSTFYTKHKEEADFMQYVFNVCGYRATIFKDVRKNKTWKAKSGKVYFYEESVSYRVTPSVQNRIALTPSTKKNNELVLPRVVSSKDGYKYCFTVPTGFLLLRRNDKVFVTGNCGKTFLLGSLYQALPEAYKERVHFSATTNKASQELQLAISKFEPNFEFIDDLEFTRDPATNHFVFTVYKKLSLMLWGKDKLLTKVKSRPYHIIPRDSILIVDEASFIDYDLLKFIHETVSDRNVKIIFVGDKNQLCPIGLDVTPAFDLDEMEILTLHKIMRQEREDSYIREYTSKIKDFIEGNIDEFPMMESCRDIEQISQKEFERLILETYQSDNTFRVLAQTNSKVAKYNQLVNQHMREDKYPQMGDVVTVNTRTKHFFTDESLLVMDSVEDVLPSVTVTHVDAVTKQVYYTKTWDNLKGRYLTCTNGVQVARYFVPYQQYKTREIVEVDTGLTTGIADLRLISASTVHKAQGSTYDYVFLDLNTFSSQMDEIELARLLYVALSRAKIKVYVAGCYVGVNA